MVVDMSKGGDTLSVNLHMLLGGITPQKTSHRLWKHLIQPCSKCLANRQILVRVLLTVEVIQSCDKVISPISWRGNTQLLGDLLRRHWKNTIHKCHGLTIYIRLKGHFIVTHSRKRGNRETISQCMLNG